MAFKKVLPVEIWSILRRWTDGQHTSAIALACGCDRKTVRAYVEMARNLGINREDIAPERKGEVLPLLQKEASARLQAKATSRMLLEPHVEEILALLNDPDNPLKPKTAYEVIVQRHELQGKASYSTFKRLARARGLTPEGKRDTCRVASPQDTEKRKGMFRLHGSSSGNFSLCTPRPPSASSITWHATGSSTSTAHGRTERQESPRTRFLCNMSGRS